MLRSDVVDYRDIQGATDLFEQLSISLDNKFLKHKHIASNAKPIKLKRLLKGKSSATTYCSRCKKETVCSENEYEAEKEVDVNKAISLTKKVHFSNSCTLKDNVDFIPSIKFCKSVGDVEFHEGDITEQNESELLSESVPVSSSLISKNQSIIGNNEFWLPQYSFQGTKVEEGCSATARAQEKSPLEDDLEVSSLERELIAFFNSIFQKTIKGDAKIIQVVTVLDGSVITLTQEYIFTCQRAQNLFNILDAIALRDVHKIMVDDASSLVVLEVFRASALTEFKEFVPGFSEKTESFISSLVFALSRLKRFLPDVMRLPLLSLPSCKIMKSWLASQGEEILYVGLAQAETIQDVGKLTDECFMMKMTDMTQFHPVTIFLSTGFISITCNGGCELGTCKCCVTLDRNDINVIRREDNPWPNCVRLITTSLDIIFASSNKETADNLAEKLYPYTRQMNNEVQKIYVHVLVTEYSLQLFKITHEKCTLFGSPLLNLDVASSSDLACVIEPSGIEAADEDMSDFNHRWHLAFLSEEENARFQAAAIVQ